MDRMTGASVHPVSEHTESSEGQAMLISSLLMLVSSGCRNKTPQTGRLKNGIYFLEVLEVGRLEVEELEPGEASPQLADSPLLAMPWCGQSSVPTSKKERALLSSSFAMDTSPTRLEPYICDLISP